MEKFNIRNLNARDAGKIALSIAPLLVPIALEAQKAGGDLATVNADAVMGAITSLKDKEYDNFINAVYENTEVDTGAGVVLIRKNGVDTYQVNNDEFIYLIVSFFKQNIAPFLKSVMNRLSSKDNTAQQLTAN